MKEPVHKYIVTDVKICTNVNHKDKYESYFFFLMLAGMKTFCRQNYEKELVTYPLMLLWQFVRFLEVWFCLIWQQTTPWKPANLKLIIIAIIGYFRLQEVRSCSGFCFSGRIKVGASFIIYANRAFFKKWKFEYLMMLVLYQQFFSIFINWHDTTDQISMFPTSQTNI